MRSCDRKLTSRLTVQPIFLFSVSSPFMQSLGERKVEGYKSFTDDCQYQRAGLLNTMHTLLAFFAAQTLW